MEANSLKIQNKKSRFMTEKELVNPKPSGHLIFNIPKPPFIEKMNEEFPLLSLPIKNQSELYKIGKSFISDIEKGLSVFGFASVSKNDCEKHLLAYGSFIHYTLKRPVLIIVEDLSACSWDKYRKNFSMGSLWSWECSDWSGLCFVDYSQIKKHADRFNFLNFGSVTNEFAAVIWSLPLAPLDNVFPKNAISILEKINSITLLVKKGETLARDLKQVVSYYQSFEIPLKGILTEGEVK